MDRKKITEEMKVHEEWFKEADGIRDFDQWRAFADRLMGDYLHDYGTICHAIAAIALAAAWAANRHENGGITGFQAGCVMWGFIQHWNHTQKHPQRLVNFSEMLYPQYDAKFAKTITPETWAYLQTEAVKLLEEKGGSVRVRAHWQSIVRGNVPFGYEVAEK